MKYLSTPSASRGKKLANKGGVVSCFPGSGAIASPSSSTLPPPSALALHPLHWQNVTSNHVIFHFLQCHLYRSALRDRRAIRQATTRGLVLKAAFAFATDDATWLLIALLKKRKLGHFRPRDRIVDCPSWQTFVRACRRRTMERGGEQRAACNCRANNQRPRGGTIST